MKYDVFISYSSKDQKVVEGICGYLESQGIRCFVAYRDIPKGKVWASAIVEGLDNSSMMLIAFSESFNRSAQVDREIELAAEDKKPILTFRLTDVNFVGAKKYYLKNINWIDAFPNPEECFGELHENICSLLNISNSSRTDNGVEINTPSELKLRHISDSANNQPDESVVAKSLLMTAAEGAEIHIDTDMDCRVLQFNREIAVARHGQDTVIRLKKGRHKLVFVNFECADDRLQMIYTVEDVNSVDIITVELLPVRQKRVDSIVRERREAEEAARKKREVDERSKREEEERSKREEEERSKREAYLLQLPDDRLQKIINNGKYGFKDRKTNELLIPCIYDGAFDFSEGLAKVKQDGKFGFVDMTGKTAVPLIYIGAGYFNEGLVKVQKNWKWGFVDKTGKTVIPLIYDDAFEFREGLARVEKDGKYGFVDKTGKTVIPLIYDYAFEFREGLASVKKDGKYGFVDKSGKTAIPLIYDYADSFRAGLALVKKDGKSDYIDKTGQWVK